MADSFSLRDMNSLMTGRAPSATARADGGGLLGVLGAQSVDTEDTVDDTGFASLLAGSALPASSAKTDRITELLTNRAPSLDEVGAAASRAAFGLEGFGEALTKMRASKLAEQKTLFSVLSAQQAQQNRVATLNVQKQRLSLDTFKALIDRGDKNAKAVYDAIKFSVPDASHHQEALLAVQNAPENIDATNAFSKVPEIISAKGIPTNKPASSSSGEYERLAQKVSDGTATPLDMARIRRLTEDPTSQKERWGDEFLALEEKAATGALSPQEARRQTFLNAMLSRFTNITDRGYVQVPPTEESPKTVVSAVPKPLPTAVSENLTQAMQAVPALQKLEAGIPESGRIQGLISKGQTLVGANPKAIEFETGRANLKLAAQALIKGIPSNFDVQTVIDTLPDLTLPEPINRSRLAFTRNALRMMAETTVGYYKGMNYNLPPSLLKFVTSLGVDPAETTALSQEDLESRTQAINAQLKAASQGIAAGVTPGARIRVEE